VHKVKKYKVDGACFESTFILWEDRYSLKSQSRSGPGGDLIGNLIQIPILMWVFWNMATAKNQNKFLNAMKQG
jgi:hypothetical protein